ncbi:putative entry exclusion protein TrbK-alt [Acidiphilium sp.]|uniref:putative entry exclusion protein TrbK-alt n=1 Tax=Acidiphilium sp. TaxID=527 RepID=UPI0025855533|nr:putative entry exclusion protein TrbK-alt [Acidiphilium sp.]
MNAKTLVIIGILSIATPAWAATPTIDQLVANPTLLNTEMDRCKHLGMAANDDARCRTAWQAENKRFFGNGVTYTPEPVNIFRNTPNKLVPAEKQWPIPPAPAGAPHG